MGGHILNPNFSGRILNPVTASLSCRSGLRRDHPRSQGRFPGGHNLHDHESHVGRALRGRGLRPSVPQSRAPSDGTAEIDAGHHPAVRRRSLSPGS
jgi:hypothetical protein